MLKPLSITIDFNNHAGPGTGPLWVRKEALHPVRRGRPGEVTQQGETVKAGQVVILPAGATDRAPPLYCMDKTEFLNNSLPQKGKLTIPGSTPMPWFVEVYPRRAFFVPGTHGPFHLDAPSAWAGHKGWDVQHLSGVRGSDGTKAGGFMLVETPYGPMFDRAATEAGQYRIVAQPS